MGNQVASKTASGCRGGTTEHQTAEPAEQQQQQPSADNDVDMVGLGGDNDNSAAPKLIVTEVGSHVAYFNGSPSDTAKQSGALLAIINSSSGNVLMCEVFMHRN